MPEQPVVSVRATAHEWVPPDSATLHATATAAAGPREKARAEAGRVVAALTDELTGLAGLSLSVGTRRHRLSWSVDSVSSHPEHGQSRTGRFGPTGRTVASAGVTVVVRDLELLDAVVSALLLREGLQVHSVQWAADEDNPAWTQVRAASVAAALGQARDYAAALGARVGELLHLADTGLLGGGDGGGPGLRAMVASASAGAVDGPSLDPVPQQLTATVEARFTLVGVQLDGR